MLQEFSSRHTQYATGRQSVGLYRDACHSMQKKDPIVALVGFREWIFSGKVSRHSFLSENDKNQIEEEKKKPSEFAGIAPNPVLGG
jgi:hypothetical protein